MHDDDNVDVFNAGKLTDKEVSEPEGGNAQAVPSSTANDGATTC